jgi:hypothetical protein
MKRTLAVLALLIVLGGGSAAAQTRVSVSVGFGAPFVAYRPYAYRYRTYRYHSYGYRPYTYYDSRPTIIVVQPRRYAVLRHRPRRHHRGW